MNVLTGKNILIISPESWGRSYLSKHFYALELLKHNNKVWFLNAPYYRKDEYAARVEAENPGLTVVDDDLVRGLHKLPSVLQHIIIRKQIRRLQNKCNTSWDVIWSFDNSRYFMLDCFTNARVRIHHVMDDHMEYQLKRCCSSADICLGVTPDIVQECSRFNKRSFFIQHGFAPHTATRVQLDKGEASRHIAYIGNLLLPSFDRELIYELAVRNSDVRFHLIGSYGTGNLNSHTLKQTEFLERFKKLDNVILYGEQTYDDALTLASQADVLCLMYFDTHNEVAGNSSKILPYLSTGKVVISNYFDLYDGMNLLEMVSDRNEYNQRLQDILSNLHAFNSIEQRTHRITYAQEHSYQHQIERIDQLLATTLS